VAKQYADKLHEKAKAEKASITRLEQRLGNKNYAKNAPPAIINQTRRQLEEAEARLQAIEAEYKRFTS
jgi:valyl-tRNA synthetase